ncbi:hypothetical protein [Burkholderia ubonensis]|uniref:hypothetical protein n=1 Tax=Burkholderia ubonensis TaxID=101571 RepID=UPI000B1AD0DA|nr:hypothetical protein [Burkholderia ubonensis]
MGDQNHQRNTRVTGKNNVVGDNNSINSNNQVENRQYHNHYHGQTGSSGSDDAAGMLFGLGFAVLVVAWKFINNADTIFHYLQQATLWSTLPSVIALLISILLSRLDTKNVLTCTFGLAISLGAYAISIYTQAQLPRELIEFSQRTTNAWTFWKNLNHDIQNIVAESLLSALAVGVAALFSGLMGIFLIWDNGLNGKPAVLHRILGSFRPSRGGIFGAFCLIMAILFSSGLFFQFWDSLRSSQHL